MEKRTLLAIVISIFVIVAYDYFFVPKRKVTKAPTTVNTEAASPAATAKEQVAQATSSGSASPEAPVTHTYTLENPKIVLVFDSWGARLIKASLKDYHAPNKKDEQINIIDVAAAQTVFPLGLTAQETAYELKNTEYSVRQDTATSLTFIKRFGELELHKTFTLEPDNYLVKMQVVWQNISPGAATVPAYSLLWEPTIYKAKNDATDEIRVVANVSDEIRAKKLQKIKTRLLNQKYEEAPPNMKVEKLQWLAISSHYFIAAVIPKGIQSSSVVEKIGPAEQAANQVRLAIEVAAEPVLQNNSVSQNYEIYLGPKEINRLQALGAGMEDNIDFGFFGMFSKFLLHMLRFIDKYVGNYGWSIIILSILIKIVTYPLAHKSFVSMKKMQKITPLMNEIKEKYKGDQQRINQEIMNLYKNHKVNPLGGCLPMVIQMPVLFGLFNTLRTAIELRGAPFMWWMTDLSQKDPYYILPVLMGITMFLQQRMTPVTDPMQAKMMYFMPVIMTIMFINLSSGLFIYFIVSNILTVTQQYIINKQLE